MMKRMSMVVLAVVLALYFAVPVLAQDMPAKEEKKAMVKEAGPVKQVACDPACGFVVQSRDEKEICSMVKQHAKTHHNMKLSDKDVKSKITDVPAK